MTDATLRQIVAASPRGSWPRFLWWQLMKAPCQVWCKLFYRMRIEGREHFPRTGPVLIVSNHD